MRNSIVTNNTADADNDGVGTGGGVIGAMLHLTHTIIAGNHDQLIPDFAGPFTATYSLIGTNLGTALSEAPIGSPDANGNLIGGPIHGAIDPLLGPLADNGGPTLTHALLPGSPAINAGDPTLVAGVGDTPAFDQRGEPFRRIAEGRIDIGAFESQSLIVDTLVDEADGDFSAGDFSLREAIELANQIAGTNTIEFSTSLAGGTISLTIGSLNIRDGVEIVGLGEDELTITNVLTQGPIFNIDDQLPQSLIEVTLAGLTLTGSTNSAIRNTEDLTVESLTVCDNTGFSGGGIRVEIGGTARAAGAKLTVRNSTFNNNHSTAPSSSNQGGGAIYFTGFNGQLTVENSVFNGNHANTLGGGIFVAGLHALVQIRDTKFDGNTAGQGGGVAMIDDITEAVQHAMFERLIVTNNIATRAGGGIYVSGKGLEIIDSHIVGNQTLGTATVASSGEGGGINKIGGGTFIIRGTTISDNHSSSVGGGIALVGPWLTLLDSQVENNTAKSNGGGISILGGSTVELRRATISGNSASSNGGGFYMRSGSSLQTRIFDSTVCENVASISGGGFYISAGTVDVINTTVSGNQADESGGGFLLGRAVSQTSFRHNTITNNTADADQNGKGLGGGISAPNNILINLDHTIVAGNFDLSGTAPEISGNVNSRYSLVGSGAEFLGPLANNGGPTLTHALLPGSPAIDAGDPALIPGSYGIAFDQRGAPFRRISGGRIDIGALESQSLIVDTLVDEADGDYSAGDFSLREAVKLANQFPGFNKIEFAPHLAGGTIYLIQGEIAISDAVEIVGLGADLLTIDASSSDLTPDLKVGDGSRVFNVTTQSQVSFAGMTITGGDAAGNGGGILGRNFSLQEVNVVNNAAYGAGGGISGTKISVVDSVITGNLSTSGRGGGGIGSYGQLYVSHSTISNNDANIFAGAGGGIWATGQVTIEYSVVDNNRTNAGSGGIRVEGAAGVSVRHSTISNNVGTTYGGGIGVRSGYLNIENSKIIGNGGEDVDGGGVWSGSGEIRISDSVISGNVGRNGGGIFAGRILILARTTVSENYVTSQNAFGRGGGIHAYQATIWESTIADNSAVMGGGIYTFGSGRPLNIVNSTIEGNFAESSGGGIFGSRGQITQSTISNNTASIGAGLHLGSTTQKFYLSHNTITLNNARGIGGGVFSNGTPVEISNTIIAGNLGSNPDLAGVLGVNLYVSYSIIGTNRGNNLQRTFGTPDANGNLIGGASSNEVVNPQLGPLGDNGGPTHTHALLSNSPAINAGSSTHLIGGNSLPEFDQRGAPFARIANGRIDIGAYESQPAAGVLNGDFDGDGDVDGRDFLAWQRGAGTTPADKSDGDATGNNIVDSQDLAVWQETYGQSGLNTLQPTLMIDYEVTDSVAVSSLDVPSGTAVMQRDETGALGSQVGVLSYEEPEEDFDFSMIANEPVVDETSWDTAFDNWLPQRAYIDFGDIATRRAARHRSANR